MLGPAAQSLRSGLPGSGPGPVISPRERKRKKKNPISRLLASSPASSAGAGADLHPATASSGAAGVLLLPPHPRSSICIIMKSFMSQANKVQGVIPYAQKIGLPESRSLYTVLRSPHIDKKSREQFSMHVKKQFLVQKAETHELQKKLFWLKRLRLLGAQYEIQISFKTRLDKSKLQAAL
uniref:Small ribosomal subunit protein uS10 domain-containing protein n=1 Tax=Oryza barthii TaxID=65489 RepID=A0A0D3GHI5_9ORYZ